MSEYDHKAAGSIRVRANEDGLQLPALADALTKNSKIGLLFIDAVANERRVDEMGVKAHDGLAGNHLLGVSAISSIDIIIDRDAPRRA